MDYEREIPFGVFDSELMHQEISIPDGFTATIEGDKIILTRIESEDEKIKKAIVATIHLYYGEPLEDEAKEMLAWLEKQGSQKLANSAKTCKDEQKPTDEEIKTLLRTEYEKGRADAIAEMQNLAWSEEDEEFLRRAINATKDAYPITAKWLKSLRPQNRWKPTELQMDVLLDEVNAWTKGCPKQKVLESLYNDLKKLMEE